jgi:glycosyltransferase involved in cell wall biosynthesis
MHDTPLVSVIIPCYNHENYVEQCVLSVINQTYKNIQLIVIDDGSKDNSNQVLTALSSQYHFTYEHRLNHGLTKTLNYAIKKYAAGKYIAVIASDDYWELDKIGKQVTFMETHEDYGMCCGMAKIVDGDNNLRGIIGKNIKDADLTLDNLLLVNKVPALTAMYKRDAFLKLNGYDEDLYFEDWNLWLKIAQHYKIGIIREILGYYRLHEGNMSGKSFVMIENHIKLLKKWSHHPNFKKAMHIQHFTFTRLTILSQPDKKQAFLLWRKQLKNNFSNYHYYFIFLKLIFNK